MATQVEMPQMGESVVEGTIIGWLKSEGEGVEADEAICEVSTDKVDTEIPSPVAGTLTKILVQEGDTVEVGTALCEIDTDGAADEEKQAEEPKEDEGADQAEDKEAEPSKAEEAEEEPAPKEEEEEPRKEAPKKDESARPAAKAEADAPSGKVLSPLVRRLAREHDVDLDRIKGSGTGDRITKQDVMAYVERGDGKTPAKEAPAKEKEPARAAPPAAAKADGERTSTEPLSHIRKRIAEHMVSSLQTSARAWNLIEVDMESIAELRKAVNPGFRQREGFSLTYLPFISRAVCDALARHPLVNATVSEDVSEVTYHNYVNLGVAVATDYGLIVPVVKGAEALNVVGIARAISDLASKARSKDLTPDDVGGSTFSITNPGPYGSYASVPVINQPNVAILGTEVVEKRVVVVDDMIAIRHRMFLSMSWDHRLLDGSDAMEFLKTLKENLETWDFSNEVS